MPWRRCVLHRLRPVRLGCLCSRIRCKALNHCLCTLARRLSQPLCRLSFCTGGRGRGASAARWSVPQRNQNHAALAGVRVKPPLSSESWPSRTTFSNRPVRRHHGQRDALEDGGRRLSALLSYFGGDLVGDIDRSVARAIAACGDVDGDVVCHGQRPLTSRTVGALLGCAQGTVGVRDRPY